jgi:hypothetical protein
MVMRDIDGKEMAKRVCREVQWLAITTRAGARCEWLAVVSGAAVPLPVSDLKVPTY